MTPQPAGCRGLWTNCYNEEDDMFDLLYPLLIIGICVVVVRLVLSKFGIHG